MNDRRVVTLSCVPSDPEQARQLLEQIDAQEVEIHPDDEAEVRGRIALAMAGKFSSHQPEGVREKH